MSISPREVWSSLPADRRGVILDDLAALLREMSHDLGPRHAAAPVPPAVIYIRQSTPHQVLTNQESLRLQYALRQRACDLGWHDADVEVIDIDLGQSGAVAEHRRRERT